MTTISISELKKHAKLLRKNNKKIKNHSESLDLIASDYNFKKWDDLINNSSLIFHKKGVNNTRTILNSLLASETAPIISDIIIVYLSARNKTVASNDMWFLRTSSFIKSLINILVILRDKNEIPLNIDNIIKFMQLEKIYELTKREDIDINSLSPIRNYLTNSPSYQEDFNPNNISMMEHHGYVTMLLSSFFNETIN